MDNGTDKRPPFLASYRSVRTATGDLCATLETEDYGLQAMPDTSPPKWHLAHTSWFFETFILKPFVGGYRPFDARYEYLFNSYYHGVGSQYPRPQRGLLSRPTVAEVYAYRVHVDDAMEDLLGNEAHPDRDSILARCELGLHHEQQHQELLCTDIKYSFSFNPLYPALVETPPPAGPRQAPPLAYREFPAADVVVGHRGSGFHFDNEVPAHRFCRPPFRLASRLVTNTEYRDFMADGGYDTPGLWLSDGWAWKQERNAQHPFYWQLRDGEWFEYTLHGMHPLGPAAPVSHVNYYEADAYARWCGKRLPTEQEWESACRELAPQPAGDPARLHPEPAAGGGVLEQMFGALWQWTASSYLAYPGYRPAAGAIGEYNGKFMCNQMVLRGSSCLTPPGHARASYRNFFYPGDQWQFSGIRLADDL